MPNHGPETALKSMCPHPAELICIPIAVALRHEMHTMPPSHDSSTDRRRAARSEPGEGASGSIAGPIPAAALRHLFIHAGVNAAVCSSPASRQRGRMLRR